MGNDSWYIVQCNPNCERKAVAEIRRAGFRAHMPRIANVHRHHRTKEPIVKRRPLLTGYVFMRFPSHENFYVLRQCQGVKGVLYVDGKPFRLKRSYVADIIRAQRGMEFEDGNTRSIRREMRKGNASVREAERQAKLGRFRKGMHVTAHVTTAERTLARIEAITKKGTVRAVILSEGREMPVEFIDIDNLKLVDETAEAA